MHFHRGARVVLHVAGEAEVDAPRARVDRVLELGEDLRVRLLQDVREHVQPAAVRHPNQHVGEAPVGGAGHDLVHHGHEHVEPFDGEACLAGEGPLQEALEDLDLRHAVEQNGEDHDAETGDEGAAGIETLDSQQHLFAQPARAEVLTWRATGFERHALV